MSSEAGATQSDQIRPVLIPGAFIKHGRQEQKSQFQSFQYNARMFPEK